MKKALALLACIFLCATTLAGCGLRTQTMEESEEVVEHIGSLTFIKIDKIFF